MLHKLQHFHITERHDRYWRFRLLGIVRLGYARYAVMGYIRMETRLFVDLWPSADHLEAMRAFSDKRPPDFNQGS